MTSEQTEKNIELLKNFIMPFDCELIFFDFSSASEFTIKFYDYINWDEMGDIRLSKMQQGLPYARIAIEDNIEVLLYMDEEVTLNFNLIKNEVIRFKQDQKINFEKVRQELAELFWNLKKSG